MQFYAYEEMRAYINAGKQVFRTFTAFAVIQFIYLSLTFSGKNKDEMQL